jgi:type I restriction enzyme R subunit
MNPEEEARQDIDQLLEAAGWQIQDYRDLNLGAKLGVAVREFPVTTGSADYLLFVNREAVGAIYAAQDAQSNIPRLCSCNYHRSSILP